MIDWLMALPPLLNQQLRREVANQGGATVKFLSVFERHAIDEAAKKARIEGESALLSRLLTRRFGPLPTEVQARLATASTTQLEHWADRVFDAGSLEDVFQ
ncbi:hypothetical protein S7S_12230 [Isoalcanivorax pacificus W11-5]|uniref:DUF4351 domain-containing protein n=1 Tax=Isoalcanivorax pacificus W11-5 TaxID=391936 RepID=A0A0B4XQZ2_9GAMM|nr:hypothetical protein S7S_12230 [Isoalcanivorax pacificus W11-5]